MKEKIKEIYELLIRRSFLIINYIPKRIRIVSATLLMTLAFLVSTFVPFQTSWFLCIPLLLFITYVSTFFAIFEGIDGVEWYMLFVTSLMLVVALYIFYFLLPVRWITRVPFVIIFGLLYYATLLSSNILNVGVEKSLPLYRAAFSVNYFIHTCIMFLFSLVILTMRQYFMFNGLSIAFVTFPISLQLYWSVNPKSVFDTSLAHYALFTTAILLEAAVILSFVPIKPNMAALLYTAIFYSCTGIIDQHLDQRLFSHVIREYVFVLLFVFVIVIFTIQW